MTELANERYPQSSYLNLVLTSVALAKKHRQCSFQVKCKDIEDVDSLQQDPALASHWAEAPDNFHFLRLPRYVCSQVIDESDIVIAAAWTTPGSDALLLGKRVIFYNEVGEGGAAFAGLPDLVAESPEELIRLFRIAIRDYRHYQVRHENILRQLDPYCDGCARERCVDELLRISQRNRKDGRPATSDARAVGFH
jgi:hypothetical protein